VSASTRASTLAPFQVPSFRFQWPADLATSFAFEMETLILGWYVLVETRSVFMLTVFASLLYVGTLLAPMFGVIGDRIGHRNLLSAMRGIYATCATTLMIFAYTGVLTPVHVLVIAAIMGMVRPSDIGMRAALVGETMPADRLVGAMGIQRTTQDTAKIAGALTGAGLVAQLGIGPAYSVVTSLYVVSVLLTLKAGSSRAPHHSGTAPGPRASPWRDLREGVDYVWGTPHLLAVMCLAFLLNLTAFPLMNGLLPYVVKEVYGAGQTTLGYMAAGAALGALTSSIMLSRIAHFIRPARAMIFGAVTWYVMLIVFAHTPDPHSGGLVLVLAGCAHSVSQVPMAAMLLRNSDAQYRGRIMGIRMLAIYGNMPGLLLSGPLIARFGYSVTATLYCMVALAFIALIVAHWRSHLWRLDAPSNTR
jgi:predicted MFS family arabinose efflux permease